ncbi:WD40 repeat protein [Phytomonospora endophytica]|uniref:WD40 repeat protein n=1 Tax=Phytomonospora endophytica TaxID=714109 RepID=A0A841FKQ5_9ACTN|nr:WD40 repeat protein [Phytomonospora endophytica]GIG65797.1 hypothetical protein Pen01_20920 [Phytomonospora endophytica]
MQKTPSQNVDLIFAARTSGMTYGNVIGVPILNESALLRLIRGRGDQPVRGEFADLTAIAGADADELHAILEAADWAAFTPERDLPILRARLTEIEAAQGIGDAHRLASAKITDCSTRLTHPFRNKGFAELHHPFVHVGEVRSAALSPCGRWLAVGSGIEIPDEDDDRPDAWGIAYRGGGTLQVFELETGRPVNRLHNSNAISGGIGWNEYRDALRWSADSTRLAGAFHTNAIGVWDPFGDNAYPDASADITDGASRPPQFGFSPDGKRVWVDVRTDGAVWGAIADVERGGVRWDPGYRKKKRPYGGDFTILAEDVPAAVEEAVAAVSNGQFYDDALYVEKCLGWSPDGAILRFASGRFLFAVDIADGRVAWLLPHGNHVHHADVEIPIVFSPCGRFVACAGRKAITVADARTGEVLARHDAKARTVVWTADGERFAALARDGVRVFDRDTEVARINKVARERDTAMPDAGGFVWSPDGTRAAVLTGEGVEIWSLAGDPVRETVFAAPDAAGIHWGTGDVIVAIGRDGVRFTRADGTVVGGTDFHATAAGHRPLMTPDGEDRGRYMGINPGFALDAETWAVAFDDDELVIAPPSRLSDLDDRINWTVGLRHSWPFRWGETLVVPDARAAYDHAVSIDSPLRYSLCDVVGSKDED